MRGRVGAWAHEYLGTCVRGRVWRAEVGGRSRRGEASRLMAEWPHLVTVSQVLSESRVDLNRTNRSEITQDGPPLLGTRDLRGGW